MVHCWLWGACPPQTFSAQVGYLPGCVEFACSPCVHKGFRPLRTTTEKHVKRKNSTILSVPDRDGRFTWSPGAEKLPTAHGGSWRKEVPGWEKSRARIHGDLRPACACVCVCSVCVCVCVCV